MLMIAYVLYVVVFFFLWEMSHAKVQSVIMKVEYLLWSSAGMLMALKLHVHKSATPSFPGQSAGVAETTQEKWMRIGAMMGPQWATQRYKCFFRVSYVGSYC